MTHHTISRRTFVRRVGVGVGAGLTLAGRATSAAADRTAAADAEQQRAATAENANTSTPNATSVSNASKVKLGFDHFSVRAFGWKAPQLIDYAGGLKVDSLLLSEANVFESDSDAYLRDLKARADGHGLALYSGMGSICPSSNSFDAKAGTVSEQIARAIRIAKGVGSPVIRCYLGRADDRLTPGGIEAHIERTVAVCKEVRTQIIDAGSKLAIENHAGDMQSWELASLIEAAGHDYVGANIDPGNAVWTMEDPLSNLETLAPYVVCTSVRDSALWEAGDGVTVQWTAMGDGQIAFGAYAARLAERCPGVPLHIESISGVNRHFPVWTEEFWKPWPKARAYGFGRWLALARKGRPREPFTIPPGQDRRTAEQAYQKNELERSLAYCRDTLGLGIRR